MFRANQTAHMSNVIQDILRKSGVTEKQPSRPSRSEEIAALPVAERSSQPRWKRRRQRKRRRQMNLSVGGGGFKTGWA